MRLTPLGNEIWNNEEWNNHREDGPAYIRHDMNHYEWWLNGKIYTRKKYFKALKIHYGKTDIDIFLIALEYPNK